MKPKGDFGFWILDFGLRGIKARCAWALVFTLGIMFGMGVAHGDSLFKVSSVKKGTLIAKQNRFDVGDIVTVLVNESINASTTSNTNTKKEASVGSQADAKSNEFLVAEKPGGLNLLDKEQLPNWDIAAKNETKARGQTNRVATLKTAVSCVVMEVRDNGILSIEGEKTVSMNREDCRLSVSGLVRARDITPANTISSNQLANATVSLKGRGPLWNNQRRGLVTRFLDWFSPF